MSRVTFRHKGGLLWGCLLLLWSSSALQAAEHVVSLSPALTELICLLGAEEALVARSSACNYPENVKKLPVAGDFAIPSVEKILQLNADLVVTNALVDGVGYPQLAEFQIPVLHLPLNSIADYCNAVKVLGQKLNREEAAEKEIQRVNDKLTFYQKTPYASYPPVLVLIWDDPPYVPGKGAFYNEFLALAGGKNPAETIPREYFAVSDEWVLLHPVEHIFVSMMEGVERAEDLRLSPVWQELPAWKKGQIHFGKDQDVLCRPGPRMFEAIEYFRKILHPELYRTGKKPAEEKEPGTHHQSSIGRGSKKPAEEK